MSEPSLLHFLLVVSLFTIVTVPLYQYVKRGRRDLFEPIYLAAFVFLLMFWYRSVYVLMWGSDLLGDPPFPPDILRAWNTSWLYLLLAIVLFYKSYYSRLGAQAARAFAPLPGQWDLGRAYAGIGILFAVGLAALLILVRQFGSLTSYLFLKSEVFSTLGTGPLVLFEQCLALSMQVAYTVLIARRSRRAQIIFALVALPAIIAQAVQGIKGAFLFMFLSLLMLRHYVVRPIRLRSVFLLALVGILLVFPAFTALRQASDLVSYQQGWEDYLDPVRVLDIATQRFSGIEALVFIIRDTPRVMNYQFGKTYLSVLVSWIPREVWPEKPILGFGQVFTPIYLGHVFAPGGTTYAPTIFGEAYVNFHVVGIILVAVLGGIFLRAFHEYLIVRNGNLSGIFIYAVTLPYVLVGLEAHSVAWLTTGWLFLVSRGLSSFVKEPTFGSRRALGTRIVRAER
jgi:oligosaccharide repeat unit polymerase